MKIIPLCFLLFSAVLLPCVAHAQNWQEWQHHIDIATLPQADDTYSAVYADFTYLLKSTFQSDGVFDENSIRVAPLHDGLPGEAVKHRFIKVPQYDAVSNAAGTIIFEVAGTREAASSQYRVYFDTTANGSKAVLPQSGDVPEIANMVWNGGFEILSQDYKGANRYTNSGHNMPVGWWGNFKNKGILENKATAAHSGNYAMGIVASADNHVSVAAAPSPPALRVQPGENYLVSFWIKGENLTGRYPTHASVHWMDAAGNRIDRINLDTGVGDAADYDWKQISVYLPAPDNAESVSLYVGTYSETGLLTIDDIVIRIAVPPLLQ